MIQAKSRSDARLLALPNIIRPCTTFRLAWTPSKRAYPNKASGVLIDVGRFHSGGIFVNENAIVKKKYVTRNSDSFAVRRILLMGLGSYRMEDR